MIGSKPAETCRRGILSRQAKKLYQNETDDERQHRRHDLDLTQGSPVVKGVASRGHEEFAVRHGIEVGVKRFVGLSFGRFDACLVVVGGRGSCHMRLTFDLSTEDEDLCRQRRLRQLTLDNDGVIACQKLWLAQMDMVTATMTACLCHI